MSTSMEIEMEMGSERDERLFELTAGFAAASGPVQGAMLAFLAAVREAEMRQGEAIAGLEQETAARDLRIAALTSENAGLQGTITALARDNEALRAEREAILQVNRALLDEREAFQAVEIAIAKFRGTRRAAEAVLAAAPFAGRESETEEGSVLSGIAGADGSLGKLCGTGAPVDADGDTGEVSTTGGMATADVDIVFRLPSALVDEIDRVVDAGRFRSRDALAAAAIIAAFAPDEAGAATFVAAAGHVDRIGPKAGGRTIQG